MRALVKFKFFGEAEAEKPMTRARDMNPNDASSPRVPLPSPKGISHSRSLTVCEKRSVPSYSVSPNTSEGNLVPSLRPLRIGRPRSLIFEGIDENAHGVPF
jgi:hypothetical protein